MIILNGLGKNQVIDNPNPLTAKHTKKAQRSQRKMKNLRAKNLHRGIGEAQNTEKKVC